MQVTVWSISFQSKQRDVFHKISPQNLFDKTFEKLFKINFCWRQQCLGSWNGTNLGFGSKAQTIVGLALSEAFIRVQSDLISEKLRLGSGSNVEKWQLLEENYSEPLLTKVQPRC